MQDADEKVRNMHIGRMIHTLANQMKRADVDIKGAEDLTPIQKHVLKYILLTTLCKDVYPKAIEEEFQICKSKAAGIFKVM